MRVTLPLNEHGKGAEEVGRERKQDERPEGWKEQGVLFSFSTPYVESDEMPPMAPESYMCTVQNHIVSLGGTTEEVVRWPMEQCVISGG